MSGWHARTFLLYISVILLDIFSLKEVPRLIQVGIGSALRLLEVPSRSVHRRINRANSVRVPNLVATLPPLGRPVTELRHLGALGDIDGWQPHQRLIALKESVMRPVLGKEEFTNGIPLAVMQHVRAVGYAQVHGLLAHAAFGGVPQSVPTFSPRLRMRHHQALRSIVLQSQMRGGETVCVHLRHEMRIDIPQTWQILAP
mmetsp:Transcript_1064/g.3104  ORF Transcript_1064/g.3104 Transcript_1064/m.3104 type:complete len:200 (-) Transcript_1064:1218-1817(-)